MTNVSTIEEAMKIFIDEYNNIVTILKNNNIPPARFLKALPAIIAASTINKTDNELIDFIDNLQAAIFILRMDLIKRDKN